MRSGVFSVIWPSTESFLQAIKAPVCIGCLATCFGASMCHTRRACAKCCDTDAPGSPTTLAPLIAGVHLAVPPAFSARRCRAQQLPNGGARRSHARRVIRAVRTWRSQHCGQLWPGTAITRQGHVIAGRVTIHSHARTQYADATPPYVYVQWPMCACRNCRLAPT